MSQVIIRHLVSTALFVVLSLTDCLQMAAMKHYILLVEGTLHSHTKTNAINLCR